MTVRSASLQGSLPRSNLVLAGPFWPISDEEGVNGDFFMQVGTNQTFIMFGPKTNNTWVGVKQCTIYNQLSPPVVYLQYSGDNAGNGVIAVPTGGATGQICLCTDIENNLGGIYLNTGSSWSPLVTGFFFLNAVGSVIEPDQPPPSGGPSGGG